MPDAQSSEPLRRIWRQAAIPVVFRRARPLALLIKVPFAPGNMEWLRDDRRNKPDWNGQYKAWEVPQAWFEKIIRLCLRRYQNCYVVQLHREQQVCAPACWNAQGFDCECSCMGENHGSGHPDGRCYEVSETLAVSWGAQKYACRLVRAPNAA